MQFTTFTAFSALVASTAARNCMNLTVPVDISARQATFNVAVPQTNSDATTFILNMTQQGRNFTGIAQTGYHTTTGHYNISAKLCQPDTPSKDPTIQVLTHGIGFDKTYWDLSYNNYNYSYINNALSKGYSTLSYDRLGIGNSSHGEPLNEIQAYLEVAALHAMTSMLRDGTFPSTPCAYKKVVHIGHSFGSAQTYSFANLYPSLTDGIVLTGFSMNSSFVGLFASGGNFQLANRNQPLRFGNIDPSVLQSEFESYGEQVADFLTPVDFSSLAPPQNLPSGYLITSDEEGNKYQFLKPGFYDPVILPDVIERTKQPVTVGELLTLGSLVSSNSFAGPVLVITGDSDLPYCGSDCLAAGGAAPSIPAQAKKNFPHVDQSKFSTVIQPNTGHGINVHYNATGAYNAIQGFLAQHNLQSS